MICLFLAEGFEEIEALTVVDLCRRAGLDITTVSITEETLVMGSHKIPVVADTVMSNVDWDSADVLVLPGGKLGTQNLASCDVLTSKLDAHVAAGKLACAICAAPALVLGARGLVDGKRACCYPGLENHLKGAEVTANNVTVDGNIVTSRGLGTSIDFALAIIEKLDSKEKADEIARSVVYKM